ncbi:MAG: CHAP domain-containing protein [Gemmatimonadaceae bacterium]|nr:CHAP domain-containing protein [Acetobacteraceae bacterium]
MRGWVVLLMTMLLSGCGSGPRVGTASVGTSTSLECAPFARQVSGIQLYGDASSWWDQAAGRYDRGPDPVPGGVLVFRSTGRLASGHVSVVRSVVSARQITVTQANWVRRRITRDEPVIDVSPGNDWSAVRVWWAPSGGLGNTVYPTYGFIAPGALSRRDQIAASDPS